VGAHSTHVIIFTIKNALIAVTCVVSADRVPTTKRNSIATDLPCRHLFHAVLKIADDLNVIFSSIIQVARIKANQYLTFERNCDVLDSTIAIVCKNLFVGLKSTVVNR